MSITNFRTPFYATLPMPNSTGTLSSLDELRYLKITSTRSPLKAYSGATI